MTDFMVSYCILFSHSQVALQKPGRMSHPQSCWSHVPGEQTPSLGPCKILQAGMWSPQSVRSSVHPHPAYSTAETRLFWRVRLSSMWCVLVSLQMLLKLKGETEWSQHFTQETVHLLNGIHCSRLSSKGYLEVAFWVGSYSGHIST